MTCWPSDGVDLLDQGVEPGADLGQGVGVVGGAAGQLELDRLGLGRDRGDVEADGHLLCPWSSVTRPSQGDAARPWRAGSAASAGRCARASRARRCSSDFRASLTCALDDAAEVEPPRRARPPPRSQASASRTWIGSPEIDPRGCGQGSRSRSIARSVGRSSRLGRSSVLVLVVGVQARARISLEELVGVVRAFDQLGAARPVPGRAGEEAVEDRHQVAGQEQGDEHAADDHDRQRLLRLRADRGRPGRRAAGRGRRSARS